MDLSLSMTDRSSMARSMNDGSGMDLFMKDRSLRIEDLCRPSRSSPASPKPTMRGTFPIQEGSPRSERSPGPGSNMPQGRSPTRSPPPPSALQRNERPRRSSPGQSPPNESGRYSGADRKPTCRRSPRSRSPRQSQRQNRRGGPVFNNSLDGGNSRGSLDRGAASLPCDTERDFRCSNSSPNSRGSSSSSPRSRHTYPFDSRTERRHRLRQNRQHNSEPRMDLDHSGGSFVYEIRHSPGSYTPSHPPSPPKAHKNKYEDEPQYIDIGPGVREPLRGSKETKAAIINDFYCPRVCYGCALDLFSIQNVLYYVCPTCKVVSPVEEAAHGHSLQPDGSGRPHHHGVGLAFTFDTLFQMQTEFMQEQHDPS